jgi:dihydropteroate synthase
MGFSKDDLMKLVQAGAGLILDVSGMTKDDLVDIAKAAYQRDTVVTFKGVAGMTVEDLTEVAMAGVEAVILQL